MSLRDIQPHPGPREAVLEDKSLGRDSKQPLIEDRGKVLGPGQVTKGLIMIQSATNANTKLIQR